MDEYDFHVWNKTFDPIFSDICKKSRLPEKWISYKYISLDLYGNSIIKPINRYVEKLYPMPELISINNNIIILRQYNHAEIFLLKKNTGVFYNVDRPWMRQYYNTKQNGILTKECFDATFKFYVPWFIDEDVTIQYKNPTTESPFLIYEEEVKHEKIDLFPNYLEPDFVRFSFKKVGSHMINDKFGKIPKKSAMFDMVFEADDIIVERVRKFYEKD